MFLDVARDGVHVAGAHQTGDLAPRPKRGPGRGDGLIHFFLSSLERISDRFTGGRIVGGVVFPTFRRDPLVVDEQAELAPVFLQPGIDRRCGFWCGTVVHGFEDVEKCAHN
jgi:hypothetical protein